MFLRVIHAAVPPEKKKEFTDFVTTTLVPTIRRLPGCRFFYVAECAEKHHEHEVVFVNGWDTEEQADAVENAAFYDGVAAKATSFYTHRYHEGAVHVHYHVLAGEE